VIVVVILVFALGGSPKKPGAEPGGPGTGGTVPAGTGVDASRVEAAKAALQKARQAEKATPDKLDLLARLYDDAARAAEGTPLADEARRASDGISAKLRTAFGDEVTALEKEIRAKADSQDFQKALDQLAEARKRRDSPDWGRAIDRMTREINDASAGHYVRVKSKALEDQSFRRTDEVQRWKNEIARWGIKRFVDDLDQALADDAAKTAGTATSPGGAGTAAPATAEGGALGPFEIDPAGFVRNWLIAGPFPNPNQTGLRFDFLGGEDRCAPAQGAEANGLDGTRARWSAYASPLERVNFFSVGHLDWKRGRNAILTYSACWLESDAEKDVEIRVGSDDGYRLWLGGKRIQEVRDRRGSERDRDTIPVKLAAGKQLLLIKVFNVDGNYEFMLRVTTPDGQRAPGVKVWN
jgi:hypothetical protein